MRFFLPLSNDQVDGERLYHMVCDRLKQTREAPAERRIYVLKFEENGHHRTIAVGDELHRFADGPVMAILQGGSTLTYYVCTPWHGGFEGEPYTVANDACVGVEEFSALC